MDFLTLFLIPAIFARPQAQQSHHDDPVPQPKFNVSVILDHWSPVVPDPGRIKYTSPFGLASWAKGRYDLFVKGDDDALYHKRWRDGKWSDWKSLGGVITSKPAAISWKSQTVAAFARGEKGDILVKWYEEGVWREWFSLGGVLSGAPAVCSPSENRIDLFYRGVDNALWHKYWIGGAPTLWIAERSLSGNLDSDPSCVSWSPRRIDVFARDMDGKLVQLTFDGKKKWSNWITHEKLSDDESPIVASRRKGVLDVFVKKTNNQGDVSTPIKVKTFALSVWTGFHDISNIRTACDPAVVSSKNGDYRMVFWQSDGIQYHSDLDGRSLPDPNLPTILPEKMESESFLGRDFMNSDNVAGVSAQTQEPKTNGVFVPNAVVGVVIAVAAVSLVVIAGLIVVLYKVTQWA